VVGDEWASGEELLQSKEGSGLVLVTNVSVQSYRGDQWTSASMMMW